MLSQAVLPEQTIADGAVRIQVIEGFIDRVGIEGGARQPAGRRRPPLRARSPPTARSASPRSSAACFSPATPSAAPSRRSSNPRPTTFAAADLTVLIEPDPFTGFAAVDNRGSRLYGPLTVTAGGSAYNLLGLNERLDALVAGAPNGDLAYGQALIDLPLPVFTGTFLDGARLEASVDASRGEPDLAKSGTPDLTVTTNEKNLRAGLIVPFIRTRSQNLYGRLGLDWQQSDSVTGFGASETTSTDRLLVLRARLTWDRADRFGGVTLVDAGFRQGLDAAGADIEAEGPAAGDPTFTLGTLTLSRLQRLGQGDWSLYAEAIGQLAANVLPNSERFALGNATIGRGFAPGNTTGDSGWGGRLELRRDLPGAAVGRPGRGHGALRLLRLRPRLRPLRRPRRRHRPRTSAPSASAPASTSAPG